MTNLTYLTPYAIAEALEAYEYHDAWRLSKTDRKNRGRKLATPHPTASEVLDEWIDRMKVPTQYRERVWAWMADQVLIIAKGDKDRLLPRAVEYRDSLMEV